MGIPMRMTVAVSGLIFTGAVALAVGSATQAGAEVLAATPHQVISGGGPPPAPPRVRAVPRRVVKVAPHRVVKVAPHRVAARPMVRRRPVLRPVPQWRGAVAKPEVRYPPCPGGHCRDHHLSDHRQRIAVVNRDFNTSSSEVDQMENQQQRERDDDRRFRIGDESDESWD